MEQVLKMAGNMGSQALWCVSDGDILIPFFCQLSSDGKEEKHVLNMESDQAILVGEKKLNELSSKHQGGAFVKDAIIHLESGKTDALISDIAFSEDKEKRVQLILPYRNANQEKVLLFIACSFLK